MSKNKNFKKGDNPRFYGQNKLLFWQSTPQPLGSFSHVATYGSSSKHIGKTNLQPILNRNSPHAHMELEFDVLDVAKKAHETCSPLAQKKKLKKKLDFSFHRIPKQQMTSFWYLGILGVKPK
jgi:hypothetical protein